MRRLFVGIVVWASLAASPSGAASLFRLHEIPTSLQGVRLFEAPPATFNSQVTYPANCNQSAFAQSLYDVIDIAAAPPFVPSIPPLSYIALVSLLIGTGMVFSRRERSA